MAYDPSWGIKRVCLFCSTKFYDFNKSPILCPKCGEIFDSTAIFKRKVKTRYQNEDEIEINDIVVDVEEVEEDDILVPIDEDIDDMDDNVGIQKKDDINGIDE